MCTRLNLEEMSVSLVIFPSGVKWTVFNSNTKQTVYKK